MQTGAETFLDIVPLQTEKKKSATIKHALDLR